MVYKVGAQVPSRFGQLYTSCNKPKPMITYCDPQKYTIILPQHLQIIHLLTFHYLVDPMDNIPYHFKSMATIPMWEI